MGASRFMPAGQRVTRPTGPPASVAGATHKPRLPEAVRTRSGQSPDHLIGSAIPSDSPEIGKRKPTRVHKSKKSADLDIHPTIWTVVPGLAPV